MLKCKRLKPTAILPTIAHPGEDFGYDLYAAETIILHPNLVTTVSTGVAARFENDSMQQVRFVAGDMSGKDSSEVIEKIAEMVKKEKNNDNLLRFGLLYRDKSSMAKKGITVSGGVIDYGYTGELLVMLTNHTGVPFAIYAGEKIVQMIPVPIYANSAEWVDELGVSDRGDAGFGSTGK